MAAATVSLTGTFRKLDGTPASGTVRVDPSVPVIRDAAGKVILGGRLTVRLDAAGAFAVDLPATDDPGLDPTGFTYTVAVSLSHVHVPALEGLELPAATAVHDISSTPIPSLVVALAATEDPGLYLIQERA